MASTVLMTQKNASNFSNGAPIDPLAISPATSTPYQVSYKSWDERAINANTAIGFGNTIQLDLTTDDSHNHDTFFEFNFGALGAGNYCKYPAMAAITTIQINDGATIVWGPFDHRKVLKAM